MKPKISLPPSLDSPKNRSTNEIGTLITKIDKLKITCFLGWGMLLSYLANLAIPLISSDNDFHLKNVALRYNSLDQIGKNILLIQPEAASQIRHTWPQQNLGYIVGSSTDSLSFDVPAIDTTITRVPSTRHNIIIIFFLLSIFINPSYKSKPTSNTERILILNSRNKIFNKFWVM